MLQRSTNEANYRVLGALVGLAAGMVVALLFAPQPGHKTRLALKKKKGHLPRLVRETPARLRKVSRHRVSPSRSW